MRILLTRSVIFTSICFTLLTLGDIIKPLVSQQTHNLYLAGVIAAGVVYLIRVVES